jgi:hypothetical protein
MTEHARHICLGCGAEYTGHAEYCNACGSERFERVGGPAPPAGQLRGDGTVIASQGALWLVCIVYLLAEKGLKHPVDVFWAWLLAAAASLVLGLVTKNLRAAALFMTLGAVFSALTSWIRSS